MSRSVKKLPNANCGRSVFKKIHKRRLRHRNKIQVDQGKEPLLDEEVYNIYDVKDYNWTDFKDEKENVKWKRK